MKGNTIAASLLLAVLAVVAFTGPVAADDQVPFRGTLLGSTAAEAFPSVVTTATGNASCLGQFTFTMPHIVNPANGQAVGTFEFVGAGGDKVYGTMTGQATPEAPGILFIVEIATITGGTGRLANARGSFRIERMYNRLSTVTSGTFRGTLCVSGAGK